MKNCPISRLSDRPKNIKSISRKRNIGMKDKYLFNDTEADIEKIFRESIRYKDVGYVYRFFLYRGCTMAIYGMYINFRKHGGTHKSLFEIEKPTRLKFRSF